MRISEIRRRFDKDIRMGFDIFLVVMCVLQLAGLVLFIGLLVVSLTFIGGSGGTGNLFFDFFGIVFGIYLVYFIITYIGFCRNVEEWGGKKGWGENEEKESCVLSLFHSGHICYLCIYPVGTDRNIGGLSGWKVMDK